MIPETLHQTWRDAHLPPGFAAITDRWRALNPGWAWRLWTDADNRALVAEHAPGLLARYDAYPRAIQRADVARYVMLYVHGGVYADLDMLPLRSLETLLDGRSCVLGLEPDAACAIHGRDLIVSNAFIACTPRHPLMAEMLAWLATDAAEPDPALDANTAVLESTGPFALTRVVAASSAADAITLLDSRWLCPLSDRDVGRWRADGDGARFARMTAGAYAVHLFAGTWWRDASAATAHGPAEEALTAGSSARRIPRTLHVLPDICQPPTARSAWLAALAALHPGWTIRTWTEDEIDACVAAHGGPYAPIFDRLGSRVERDAFFRFFVVHTSGGVFVDRRVTLSASLESVEPSAGFFAPVDRRLPGPEARREVLPDPLRLGAYAFGAVAGHPLIRAILDRWAELIEGPRTMDDLLEVSPARLLSTAWHRSVGRAATHDAMLLYPEPTDPAPGVGRHHASIAPNRVGRLGFYDHRLRPPTAEPPLVSCLCVTNNSYDQLARAVAAFAAQTHPARELVIVYESDNDETIERVRALAVSGVRYVRVPIAPKRSLGALRNLSIAEARGDYVTQWDDDDVYHPRRIEVQLAATTARGDAGNVLEQRLLYDAWTRRAWLSNVWPFEGSILVRRDVALDLAYLDRERGEETDMVFAMLDARLISRVRRPELYVYTYHGTNTFDRPHFEAIFAAGTPLDADRSARLAAAIDSGPSPDLAEVLDTLVDPESGAR